MKNYLDVRNGYQEIELKQIAQEMRNGKICLFPTETVYGIGTNGLDKKAIEKIYNIKKRKKTNPINLLVSDMTMIKEITDNISSLEYKLMETFFPGPFTIILKKKNIIPNIVTANSDFVGIRMPSGEIAQNLVKLSGVPIAAPSANISGKLSGTNLKDIIGDFGNKLDYIIDGGKSEIGIESTIVKVINNIPHILRPGTITPKQIKAIAGNVILEENINQKLPSSKMEHYQLNVDSILVYDDDTNKMIDKILNLSNHYNHPIILCCKEHLNLYKNKNSIPIASKENLEDYSKNLFSCLHKISSLCPDVVLIEGVKKEGLGIAIMNRLENVCKNKYIV